MLMPDESAPFFWQFQKAERMVKKKPDIIISRSAPFSSALLGRKLAKKWGIPWVMHLSDVWADSPFLKVNTNGRKRHNELEKQCVEEADLITLTSKETIRIYAEKYPTLKDKFHFLPNVFDEDDINPYPPDMTEKCKFVFTGRLYGSRSLHVFIDAIEKASRLAPEFTELTEFTFAGFFDDENRKRIKISTLSNIRYLGPVSMQTAVELQQGAHVLVVIDSLDTDPLYKSFFPSKLLDYIASRRKIIAITGKGGAAHDVVNEKYGFCFDKSNLDDLPVQLNEMLHQFRIGDANYFINTLDSNEYSARVNTDRLNTWLKSLL
jgi:glycosyltransferase involved in cell wall biosynthesis